jgi:polyprenyl-phospho-N-acetylgalactosaminyl synthase
VTFRPCILIPTYDNPRTIRDVVRRCREHLADVIVVDDGSAAPGRSAVEALGREGLAHVHHRDRNGGKGAAVKTGFEVAAALSYTHALQVDADGQHHLDDIPRFLEAARRDESALVLGAPVFDASAPLGRRIGREITRFWTNVETGGRVIRDPMCGFRVYPVDAARRSGTLGVAMDFDPEIAVRLVWMGLPVVNLETRVIYLSAEQGGVSSFRMFRDNVLISAMHTRLCLLGLARLLTGKRIPRLAR